MGQLNKNCVYAWPKSEKLSSWQYRDGLGRMQQQPRARFVTKITCEWSA